MKRLVVILLFCTSLVLAQLSDIPLCAQSCFAAAVAWFGCLGSTGPMDATCFCTSYTRLNNLGGHDKGLDAAWSGCKDVIDCSEDDLGRYNDALNGLCFDDEGAPRYTCGVIPGDPVPAPRSLTPTGYNTITLEGNSPAPVIDTLPAWPSYTVALTTFPLYKSEVVTKVLAGITSVYTTSTYLYLAVCPTIVVFGDESSLKVESTLHYAYPTPTTATDDLWQKITSLSVLIISIPTPTAQILMIPSSFTSSSSTSSRAVNATTTTGSGLNGDAVKTTSVSPSPSLAAAGRLGSGAGAIGGVAVAILAAFA